MFAALVALIHKTEPPGDHVEATSRLLPTQATGASTADENKIRIKSI